MKRLVIGAMCLFCVGLLWAQEEIGRPFWMDTGPIDTPGYFYAVGVHITSDSLDGLYEAGKLGFHNLALHIRLGVLQDSFNECDGNIVDVKTLNARLKPLWNTVIADSVEVLETYVTTSDSLDGKAQWMCGALLALRADILDGVARCGSCEE